MANTFGQFQTYMLVKADASQALATGCGIALNIAGLVCGILFASAAGSRHRNKFFYVGIAIQAAAMVGIAMGGGALFMIVAMIACYNIGNQLLVNPSIKCGRRNLFRLRHGPPCRALSTVFPDCAVACLPLLRRIWWYRNGFR